MWHGFVYSAIVISTKVCALMCTKQLCNEQWALQSSLTSVGNLIDVIQVDLFGAKIIVSRANGVIQLSIASVLFENYSKISILFMALKVLLHFFFRIEWPDSWEREKKTIIIFSMPNALKQKEISFKMRLSCRKKNFMQIVSAILISISS